MHVAFPAQSFRLHPNRLLEGLPTVKFPESRAHLQGQWSGLTVFIGIEPVGQWDLTQFPESPGDGLQ